MEHILRNFILYKMDTRRRKKSMKMIQQCNIVQMSKAIEIVIRIIEKSLTFFLFKLTGSSIGSSIQSEVEQFL